MLLLFCCVLCQVCVPENPEDTYLELNWDTYVGQKKDGQATA